MSHITEALRLSAANGTLFKDELARLHAVPSSGHQPAPPVPDYHPDRTAGVRTGDARPGTSVLLSGRVDPDRMLADPIALAQAWRVVQEEGLGDYLPQNQARFERTWRQLTRCRVDLVNSLREDKRLALEAQQKRTQAASNAARTTAEAVTDRLAAEEADEESRKLSKLTALAAAAGEPLALAGRGIQVRRI